MALTLESSEFKQGEEIPGKYTCDGENISPPLQWSGVPEKTRSFALIFDDPDAPSKTWVHWVMYDIPVEKRVLGEHITTTAILKTGALHGLNDFKKYGYEGPCPPSGTHRYFMKLYALDKMLKAKPGLTKQQLLDAMEGHVLEKAELMGTYRRR